MPRKLRRPKARRLVDVPRAHLAFLLTGDKALDEPTDDVLGDGDEQEQHNRLELFLLAGDAKRLRALWLQVRDAVLADWIAARPGTRPWAWWKFDGPRWQPADLPLRQCGLGEVFLRDLAEPRRRLGGIGTPQFEVLNVVPHFDAGLPTSFVTRFDQEYYNGRSKDTHGHPIGTEYPDGHFSGLAIDPLDPPTYESEAAYLDRHGLLTDDERGRLPADAFEPEKIESDGDRAAA